MLNLLVFIQEGFYYLNTKNNCLFYCFNAPNFLMNLNII